MSEIQAWCVYKGSRGVDSVSLDRDAARDRANELCAAGEHADYERVPFIVGANDPQEGHYYCAHCALSLEPSPDVADRAAAHDLVCEGNPLVKEAAALRDRLRERDDALTSHLRLHIFGDASRPLPEDAKNLFGILNSLFAECLTPIATAFGFDGPELDDSFVDFMKARAAEITTLRQRISELESAWHAQVMTRKDEIIGVQERENDGLKRDLAHLRNEAGAGSCADFAARKNEEITARDTEIAGLRTQLATEYVRGREHEQRARKDALSSFPRELSEVMLKLDEALNANASLAERLNAHRCPAPPSAAPFPLILHCPRCHLQHVDIDDETGKWATERRHRKHLCKPEDGGCGYVWAPSNRHTVGVRELPEVKP